MSAAIKLSSPATQEFWEIPVLFEDEHLLALNKPALLLTSPDRYDPDRPNLMKLLHSAIEARKPWAACRQLDYLANAHRLDFETSGVILLAKNKPALVGLANIFGTPKPHKTYVALVRGVPEKPQFTMDAGLSPHPVKIGLMRIDRKKGKKSRTDFELIEAFHGYSLLRCHPVTGRTHQIRVHLQHLKLPILGDKLYGGPPLMLSRIKKHFRLKPNRTERPLISSVALHAEGLELPHPITGETVTIHAPWPKDLEVAVKFLRRFAPAGSGPAEETAAAEEEAPQEGESAERPVED